MSTANRPMGEPHRSRPRWQRVPSVFLSASSALLREFRWPVLVFFLVTIIGGIFYGELHQLAGGDPIPLIDRPYVMLQLMILETPAVYDQAPNEWYLMLFWYTLPLIFIFIVGNGVADFVRLFFGDAWRKVLISNQEGHVIVLGAGHVGLRVVRWLRQWGKSVVVIDNRYDEDKVAILRALKAGLVTGDARARQVLLDANIDEAEAFIACTGDDTVNLYAIMRARALNPALRIVVRVWDDSFNDQIDEFILHSQSQERLISRSQTSILSSSDLASPIFAGLALNMELTQMLTLGDIDFAAVRLVVSKGSPLAGKTIGRIQHNNQADVVLYQSGVGYFQVRPARDRRVHPGDTLVLFAQHQTCVDIAKRNNPRLTAQHHVVVMGAGHVGLRVVQWLHQWGVKTTLIDNDLEAEVMADLEPLMADNQLKIVEADGRDKAALIEARVADASAFVAATGDDAINLYAIMRARALNPEMQIVVRVWDDSFNEQIEQFIVHAREHSNGTFTSVRSSANLAAPIFAGVALGIDITQTLTVRDRRSDGSNETIDVQYAVVRLEIGAESSLIGMTVDDMQTQTFRGGKRVDVMAYCENGSGDPQVPARHKSVMHTGDIVVLFAELDVCIDVALHNQGRTTA